MSLLDRLLDLEKRPAARAYTDEEYDLAGFRDWLATLGRPQNRTRWIHVAGTKGKGSTAAMIDALLSAAGLRTGLFTSPHLVHYGERFRFNGRPWTPEEFEAALGKLMERTDVGRREQIEQPHGLRTVFEMLTALAFEEFAAQQVDVGILEVGLGGRLDCTNVIEQPVVSVITPIGLDHTGILGGTIEKIAFEKAGIIKRGCPVAIFAPVDEDQERARRVIEDRAAEMNAPILDPYPVRIESRSECGQKILLLLDEHRTLLHLPMRGDYQAQNFALASRAAFEFLKQTHPQPPAGEWLAEGAARVRWPGRLEVHPGPPALVLDGAHCPMSAAALGRNLVHLHDEAPGPLTLLWGMQRDKSQRGFLGRLLESAGPGLIRSAICYEVAGGRGESAETLAALAREMGVVNVVAADSVEQAVHLACDRADHEGGSILAAGTLYSLAAIGAGHADFLARGKRLPE